VRSGLDQGFLTVLVAAFVVASCGRIGYDSLGLDGLGEQSDGSAGGAEVSDGSAVEASSTGGAAAGTGGTLANTGGTISSAGGAADSGASGNGGTSGAGGATGGSKGSGGATTDSGSGGSAGREAGPPPTGDGGTTIIDVTDPAQTVRVGAATIGVGELDITSAIKNQAGAAYVPTSYVIGPNTSFTIHFSFRIHDPSGQNGDGFAFLWQNDPRGTAAIGAAGSTLGYDPISPSVVVEFDVFGNTFDPGGRNVGIMLNGDSRTPIANQFPAFDFADGNTYYAWIDYAGATDTLSVYLAPVDVRPATALVSATVDLYGTVGSQAYIGFTAGTGVSTEYHAILSLSVDYRP
jgi:hypothetical protein